MREPFFVDVPVRRFEVWRAAVLVVAAAAIAVLVAWATLTSGAAAPDAWAQQVLLVAAAGAIGVILLAASVARVEGGRLSLRNGRWSFVPDRDPRSPVEAGSLAVAIDLGSFLLLRLTNEDTSATAGARWLPVQRRGLEGDWHALRCAVYSPPLGVPRSPAAGASPPE